MKYIIGFNGLGDNVYQRPFIREAATWDEDVYLATPWPELYKDIKGIKFVNPGSRLRTQSKNAARNKPKRWKKAPEVYAKDRLVLFYDDVSLMLHGTITKVFESKIPLKNVEFKFDLPHFGFPNRLKLPKDKKIALVRPVTLRTEWKCKSRAPLPQYINWFHDRLQAEGYFTISVADLEYKKEWLAGPPPRANLVLHKGELTLTELVSLVRRSDVVIGGSGMILPISIACQTPMICVLGGRGEWDNPKTLTDPRMEGLNRITWVVPDKFCPCGFDDHDCNKNISNPRLEAALETYRKRT